MRGPLLRTILRGIKDRAYVVIAHDVKDEGKILDWMVRLDEGEARDLGKAMLCKIEEERKSPEIPVITPLRKWAKECEGLKATIFEIRRVGELDLP